MRTSLSVQVRENYGHPITQQRSPSAMPFCVDPALVILRGAPSPRRPLSGTFHPRLSAHGSHHSLCHAPPRSSLHRRWSLLLDNENVGPVLMKLSRTARIARHLWLPRSESISEAVIDFVLFCLAFRKSFFATVLAAFQSRSIPARRNMPLRIAQNTYLSANCICRIFPEVDVILPKAGLLSELFGNPHTGWFKRL